MTMREMIQIIRKGIKQEKLRQRPCSIYNTIRFWDAQTKAGLLFCPITAACYVKTGKKYQTGQYEIAGALIGLNPSQIEAIVNQADNPKISGSIRKAFGDKDYV